MLGADIDAATKGAARLVPKKPAFETVVAMLVTRYPEDMEAGGAYRFATIAELLLSGAAEGKDFHRAPPSDIAKFTADHRRYLIFQARLGSEFAYHQFHNNLYIEAMSIQNSAAGS